MTENNHIFSYQAGRCFLEAVQEIIGKAGMNAIFNLAHRRHLLPAAGSNKFEHDLTFADLSAIQQALEEFYGPRGGRGVALRSGRVFFQYFLRSFGDQMGMTTLDFRLLPTHPRIMAGMKSMADRLSDLCSLQIEVWEDSDAWFWQSDHCPWCWQRELDECKCHFMVGMLQEHVTWAGNGKVYHVTQIECTAKSGAVCTIRIDKKPVE